MASSLIEQWFPSSAVGAESARELESVRTMPKMRMLHVWWARRPLTASRAAVLGTVLPGWPGNVETDEARRIAEGLRLEFPGGEREYHAWFMQVLGITGDPVLSRKAILAAKSVGGAMVGYGYPRAFLSNPTPDTIERIRRLVALRGLPGADTKVLDLFAGGGSIPLEITRLGLAAVANELNPVAGAILQATVVQPAILGPQFEATLEAWGARWSQRVRVRLEQYFPRRESTERLVYIWARTVPCPSTGRPTPLIPDSWLARGGDARDAALRLDIDKASGQIVSHVVTGKEAQAIGPTGTYKRGVGRSVWTGDTFDGEYIQEHAQAGNMGGLLLAINVARTGHGKAEFRAPGEADLDAVQQAETHVERQEPAWEASDLLPSEEIPAGADLRPQHHGMGRWRDLFSARQLLTNVTALEELLAIGAQARSELGQDAGNAVALYLALAFDKVVDYNSSLSSWHATRLQVRNTFDRHDFAVKWSYSEFDGAVGLVPWAVAQIVVNYREVAAQLVASHELFTRHDLKPVRVSIGNATGLPLGDESMDLVVTDPPYYDNVMYAELSDYFYVWMKRSLRASWPEFVQQHLTDKESEAVANPSLFRDVAAPRGRGKRNADGKTAATLADERYERVLTDSFKEAHRVLKSNGAMTVMFTHKRVDAWDTLGAALLEAGFSVESSWPVHTESEHSLHQARKNAASSTIFLTCNKRTSTEPAWWEDLRPAVARVARESATRFAEAGLRGVDLTIATFGPVLGVLSERWPVYSGEVDPSTGQSTLLRPDRALDLARSEVARLKKRGLLGGRDVQFDSVTDFYLMAWNDFGAPQFPAGEALKLAIASGLELEDLIRRQRLLGSASGFVELFTPGARRAAGALDVTASTYPYLIDLAQALMLLYEEEGERSAAAFLSSRGRRDDSQFRDLIQALIRVIPRDRDRANAFLIPEARMLEDLRLTLFPEVEAPVIAEPAVQLELVPSDNEAAEVGAEA